MARTTISLDNSVFKTLKNIAKKENRSAPNLIETIVYGYLASSNDIDEFEMAEIRKDKELKKTIAKSLSDYKNKHGQFV